MINKICDDISVIPSLDYIKNPKTEKFEKSLILSFLKKVQNLPLEKSLSLGIGARVLPTKM